MKNIKDKIEIKMNSINLKYVLLMIALLAIIALLIIKIVPKQNFTGLTDAIFNNNLQTMKDAARSYYTIDRMPKEVGDHTKMTLQEMLDKNMVVNFKDKDGKYCDADASYVEITKVEDQLYTLKVTLKCGKQRDFIEETIGCNDICTDCDVKVCNIEYEYRKWEDGKTSYVCPSGYTTEGSKCYKLVGGERIAADKKTSDKVEYLNANTKTELVSGDLYCEDSSMTLVNGRCVGTKYSVEAATFVAGGTTVSCSHHDKTIQLLNGKCYDPNATVTKSRKVEGTCQNYESYTNKPVEYDTDAGRVRILEVKTVEVGCTGCLYTVYVYQKCDYTSVTYYCPAGYEEINNKCYSSATNEPKKTVVESKYICPSDATLINGNACQKQVSVSEAAKKEADTNKTVYYCKNGEEVGSGSNMKCKLTTSNVTYSCASGYDLDGKNCVKNGKKEYSNKIEKTTVGNYKYMWSNETAVTGWNKTGKTRIDCEE